MNNNNSDIATDVTSDDIASPAIHDMKSRRFFPIILTLALLGLVFVSSALIAYKKKQIKQFTKNLQETIQNKNSNNTTGWKTYRNEELGYEFKYPEKNLYESSQMLDGESPTLCYLLDGSSQSNIKETTCIWTGYISQDSLNSMGIDFCGAYPENPRCELLKVNKNLNFSIDWGVETLTNGVANAQIAHPDGGLVTFTLKPVSPKSKELFIQILSTFKFLDENQKTSSDLSIQCSNNGGVWLADYDECENIDEETCSELGGVYNGCASACRHDVETGPCIQMCVEVCHFFLDN